MTLPRRRQDRLLAWRDARLALISAEAHLRIPLSKQQCREVACSSDTEKGAVAVKFFQKTEAIAIFGASCTALFFSLLLISPQVINERVEAVLLDYRFEVRNLLNPPIVPPKIVIVEIDEK